MNPSFELLGRIYRNSQTGVELLSKASAVTGDPALSRHLRSQLGEYRLIGRSALKMLRDLGETAVESAVSLRADIQDIQEINDKSAGCLSEMLIRGSTTGMIDAAKCLREYPNADAGAVYLTKKLLETEENNVRQLRQFL